MQYTFSELRSVGICAACASTSPLRLVNSRLLFPLLPFAFLLWLLFIFNLFRCLRIVRPAMLDSALDRGCDEFVARVSSLRCVADDLFRIETSHDGYGEQEGVAPARQTTTDTRPPCSRR